MEGPILQNSLLAGNLLRRRVRSLHRQPHSPFAVVHGRPPKADRPLKQRHKSPGETRGWPAGCRLKPEKLSVSMTVHCGAPSFVRVPEIPSWLWPTRACVTKSKVRAYKISVGRSMYLLVRPEDARYWRLDYRLARKA